MTVESEKQHRRRSRVQAEIPNWDPSWRLWLAPREGDGFVSGIEASIPGRVKTSFSGRPSHRLELLESRMLMSGSLDLVGHWALDATSGAVAADETGQFDATINGGTWFGAGGRIDGALQLDGVSDYVQIATNADIARNVSEVTLAAWIKADDLLGNQNVVFISDGGGTASNRALLRLEGDAIYGRAVSDDNEPTQEVHTGPVLIAGQWQHVALTIDYANDDMRIYLDGFEQATSGVVNFSLSATSDTPSLSVELGSEHLGAHNSYGGLLDDARIYESVLSASEVRDLALMAPQPSGGLSGGSETLVNTTTAGVQQTYWRPLRQVAYGPSGEMAVVWQGDGADMDSGGVYVQRYDADGAAVGSEILVNETTAGGQSGPSIAFDSTGKFTVAWSSDNTDGSGLGVMARVFNADGSAVTGEFQVNETWLDNQGWPSLVYDSNDNFIITYTGKRIDGAGTSYGIGLKRYDSDGVQIQAETIANTTTANNQWWADIAIDPSDNFVVVWDDSSQDGDSGGIYLQRFDSNGNKVGGETAVNTTTAGEQTFPTVGKAADGSFVVAWQSNGQDGDGKGVYFQRFDAAGAMVGAETIVNQTTAGNQSRTRIAVEADGDFVIVWEDDGADGDGTGVYARQFNADGTAKGDQFLVNDTTTGSQQFAGVAHDGGRQWTFVWSGEGNGDADGVFFKTSIDNDAPVADAGGDYVIDEGDSLVLDASATTDANGDVLTYAWDLDNDGNYDDATGVAPTVAGATLAGLGLASDGSALTIGVEVTDALGATGTATTTVTIHNLGPDADAGGGYTVSEDGDVALDASGSNDPGGDSVVSYGWDVLSGSEQAINLNFGATVDDSNTNTPGHVRGGVTGTNWNLITGDLGGGLVDANGNAVGITIDVGTETGGATQLVDWGADTVNTDLRYLGLGNYIDSDLFAGNTRSAMFAPNSEGNIGAAVRIGGLAAGTYTFYVVSRNTNIDPSGNDYDQFRYFAGTVANGSGHTDYSGFAVDGVSNTDMSRYDGDTGDNAWTDRDTFVAITLSVSAGEDVVIVSEGLISKDATSADNSNLRGFLNTIQIVERDFSDATGQTPTLTWAELAALGLIGSEATYAVEVLATDAEGVGKASTASSLAVNLAPTADAGGNYTIDEGDDLSLDGSASTDPGGDTLTYSWDLDNDGNYDDATGESPTVAWATLAGLGLASDGTALTIGLHVDDGNGGVDTATTTLTINNVAPEAIDDGATATTWFDTDWRHRSKLTFDNAARSETLTDFPVLVELTPDRIDYDNVKVDGSDLRFTDSDGATQLSYEIDTWNHGGTSYVWVKVPAIDANSSDDHIWMYFGNAGASDGQNAADVWSNGFELVWHLDDDPSGGVIIDSTGHGRNGVTVGNMGAGQSVDSVVGKGVEFDGVRDAVEGDAIIVDVDSWSQWTYSAWVDWHGGSNYQRLFQTAAGTLFEFFTFGDRVRLVPDDWRTASGVLGDGPAHVVATIDVDAGLPVEFYVDGVSEARDNDDTEFMPEIPDDDLYFGNRPDGNRTFDGVFDEIRFSSVVRSAAWASAEHASMAGTLLSYADAQTAYITAEDTPLVVTADEGVLANDVDTDTLTPAVVTGPSHGSVSLNVDGSFTYTPDADWHGVDTFTYQASDADGGVSVATVSIVVNPVNDAPASSDDAYAVDEDGSLNAAAVTGVLANDSDVESDAMTVSLVSGPDHGTLTFSSDGSFDYTPDADWHGVDSFTYRANDGSIDGNVATVTITVAPVNDAPTSSGDAYSVNEDASLSVDASGGVLDNDSDIEGDSLTAVLVDDVDHGTLVLNADGSFTYTPDAHWHGTDSFTYRASDGVGTSDPATVTITVGPVDDGPTGVDDAYAVNEDTPLIVDASSGVLANDIDLDDDGLTAVLVDDVDHGTLSFSGDGSFTYVADANWAGTDSFTYYASDGLGDSAATTVTISVDAVNDAPVLTLPGAQTGSGEVVFGSQYGNMIAVVDSDAAGGMLQLTLRMAGGTIYLGPATALTFLQGDGQGDALIVVQGTAEELTAALNGMRVNPGDWQGDFIVEVDDLGNVGQGGAQSAAGSITLTILPETPSQPTPPPAPPSAPSEPIEVTPDPPSAPTTPEAPSEPVGGPTGGDDGPGTVDSGNPSQQPNDGNDGQPSDGADETPTDGDGKADGNGDAGDGNDTSSGSDTNTSNDGNDSNSGNDSTPTDGGKQSNSDSGNINAGSGSNTNSGAGSGTSDAGDGSTAGNPASPNANTGNEGASAGAPTNDGSDIGDGVDSGHRDGTPDASAGVAGHTPSEASTSAGLNDADPYVGRLQDAMSQMKPISVDADAAPPPWISEGNGEAKTVSTDELTDKQVLFSIFDEAEEQAAKEQWQTVKVTAGTSLGISAGMSAGYVIWCLQGGSLLASLLATLPMWRWFDPLPILESGDGAGKSRRRKRVAEGQQDEADQDDEEDEDLKSIVEHD